MNRAPCHHGDVRRFLPATALLSLTLVAGACSGDRSTHVKSVAASTKDDAGASADGGTKVRAPTSRVLVTIVIDQMAAWIAEERWPLLPEAGGFARLRREGTWAKDVRYAHAATDTAPGHSSLYTGVPPRVSGIHGNEVFDETHQRVSILRDKTTRVLTAEGEREWASSSIARLQVDTVADKLRAAHPDALIASFSLKDRGAIFAGGRKPTASLWFDGAYGGFVTSTAFATELPKWAVPLARARVVEGKLGRPWRLLDPELVRAHAATPDAQPGEGDIGGLGVSFPHEYAGNGLPMLAARVNPAADEALFELALAAMDAEHAGTRPTLVALSLSTNDFVGHTFGPDSWEAWDELARLDASLGLFMGQLDARFGHDGWALMVGADHGVTTMPEATLVPGSRPWCAGDGAKKDRWERPCGTVGRLFPDAIGKELDRVATKATGLPGMIEGIADPYVYFTDKAHALPAPKKHALIAAIRAALSKNELVAAVFSSEDVAKPCPPDEDSSTAALVCRSFPSTAADLFVVPTAGSFWDPLYVFGKGSSHGSPHLFDRAVPVLARAPGRVDAARTIEDPLGFQVFARTACDLLDVPFVPRGSRETLVTR
jgi:hypothetical protein